MDHELIVEDGTRSGANFHHRDHVKVVWLYLHGYSVLETLGRFSVGLKRFAAAKGRLRISIMRP